MQKDKLVTSFYKDEETEFLSQRSVIDKYNLNVDNITSNQYSSNKNLTYPPGIYNRNSNTHTSHIDNVFNRYPPIAKFRKPFSHNSYTLSSDKRFMNKRIYDENLNSQHEDNSTSRYMQRPSDNDSYQKYKPEKKKKFRYHDDNNRQLTAGGIIFIDDNGIWCIKEKEKGNIVCTDIGGKYTFEDCDIYTTISRELREETYNCCEISHKDILELSKICEKVYINGHTGRPVYLCLIVPIDKVNIDFKNVPFQINRQQTLLRNPTVPEEYYSSLDLVYVPFDKITFHKTTLHQDIKKDVQLSYRLRRILKCSSLSSKIHDSSSEEEILNSSSD
jgi:hypothetical protein